MSRTSLWRAFSAGALLWEVGASHFTAAAARAVSGNRKEGAPFLKLRLAIHLHALDCSLKVPSPLILQEALGNRAPNVGTLGREWDNSPKGISNMGHHIFCFKKKHKTSQHPLFYSGPTVKSSWSSHLLCSDFQRFLDCWEG